MFPQGLSGEALSKSIAKAGYLKSDKLRCPNCGNDKDLRIPILFAYYETNDGHRQIKQEHMCNECGIRWRDTFTLSDVEFTTEWH